MKIAIIGKPFSGKTTILNCFKSKGFNVLSIDSILKKIYIKGERGWEIILKEFGKEFVDENYVKTEKLKELIINDKQILMKLISLTKPYVLHEINKHQSYVIEAPHLIFNNSLSEIKFDVIIMIDTKKEILESRLKNFFKNNKTTCNSICIQKQTNFINWIWNNWDLHDVKFDYKMDGNIDVEINVNNFLKHYNL